MNFEIIRKHQKIESRIIPPKIILHEDLWNDWFEFVTMFHVSYMDITGQTHDIGAVKIGQFNMTTQAPQLDENFSFLSQDYFSLGQDDNYYENLNRLGEDIRNKVLSGLNDIALDEELFERALKERVTTESLMRGISVSRVREQFNRMAKGGVRLTAYDFEYVFPVDEKASVPISLDFHVKPQSNPPTNIHVIIGRNGVGKTHLIKNMINSLICDDEATYGEFRNGRIRMNSFANLVCVAFSPFDEFPESKRDDDFDFSIPYKFIGLEHKKTTESENRFEYLSDQFLESLKICKSQESKRTLWDKVVAILESDPIFKESEIRSLIKPNDDKELPKKIFNRLSSGHKVVLLTITRLVETVSEKTMVLLDEPENHLHPPLVSSFIRALSELLVDRNGVAIIATHSPVILQEVPSSCVWKIRRIGHEIMADRLGVESFGGTITGLISEVFGLEVSDSGFHKLLAEALKKTNNDYDTVADYFNYELGDEAKMLLRTLIAITGDNENE